MPRDPARLPSLPIILLTGRGTLDDAVAAVKAGAVDFITKDPTSRTSSRSRVRGRCPLPERVEAFDAWLCKDALERTRYQQKEAAALLGLSYDQFRQRYRKYGLGKD